MFYLIIVAPKECQLVADVIFFFFQMSYQQIKAILLQQSMCSSSSSYANKDNDPHIYGVY